MHFVDDLRLLQLTNSTIFSITIYIKTLSMNINMVGKVFLMMLILISFCLAKSIKGKLVYLNKNSFVKRKFYPVVPVVLLYNFLFIRI